MQTRKSYTQKNKVGGSYLDLSFLLEPILRSGDRLVNDFGRCLYLITLVYGLLKGRTYQRSFVLDPVHVYMASLARSLLAATGSGSFFRETKALGNLAACLNEARFVSCHPEQREALGIPVIRAPKGVDYADFLRRISYHPTDLSFVQYCTRLITLILALETRPFSELDQLFLYTYEHELIPLLQACAKI